LSDNFVIVFPILILSHWFAALHSVCAVSESSG